MNFAFGVDSWKHFFKEINNGESFSVFANGPGDLGSIPGQFILKKGYLMPPCLTLSIIRYRSRVKWSTPRKGVAPSPTSWCHSYWKGSLWVTIDYGHQFYLLCFWSWSEWSVLRNLFFIRESVCFQSMDCFLTQTHHGKPIFSPFVDMMMIQIFFSRYIKHFSSWFVFLSHQKGVDKSLFQAWSTLFDSE